MNAPHPTQPLLTPSRRALGGLALAAVALAVTLTGCGKGGARSAAPSGPVEVGVVTLAPSAVPLTKELPGRTSAFRVAEVRARVNGIVQKRLANLIHRWRHRLRATSQGLRHRAGGGRTLQSACLHRHEDSRRRTLPRSGPRLHQPCGAR